MKLDQIVTERRKEQRGTYAGLRFSKESLAKIEAYLKQNHLPNATRPSKLHVTLLYSRIPCDDYEAPGKLKTPYVCKVDGFEIFKTSSPDPSKEGWNALVARLDCPELIARHKLLMEEYGATYDFDEYIPHFTLSYNIEDLDWKSLPKFSGTLELDFEYSEELDLDWAAKEGTK